MTKRRNASQVYRGLNFQTVASISLLIDHFETFNEIRNEGVEDIVIFLKSGGVIYAQAKQSDNEKNFHKMLKNALLTLSEDSNIEGCHKLVYITNVKKMFGAKTITADFVNGESVSMKSLDEDNVKLLTTDLDLYPGLDKDKLYFQYLLYSGDGEERNRGIKQKMEEFFSSISAFKKLSTNNIFEKWYLYLNLNGGESNMMMTCDRKKIAWGMILYLIDHLKREIYNDSEDDFRTTQSDYELLIEKITGHFEIISRIAGDYDVWCAKVPSDKRTHKNFANENWENYIDILDDNGISTINKSTLSKIIIQTILDEKRIIRDVLQEMKI